MRSGGENQHGPAGQPHLRERDRVSVADSMKVAHTFVEYAAAVRVGRSTVEVSMNRRTADRLTEPRRRLVLHIMPAENGATPGQK